MNVEAELPLVKLSTPEALALAPERRRAWRTRRRAPAFVQVPETSDAARTFKCSAADVSRGGLRLSLDAPLAPGDCVEVWLRLTGASHTSYLAAEVRWCEAGAAGFDVGVAIREAPGTDYQAWRRTSFAGLETAQPDTMTP